ncbi:hypothetical protein BD779DRAFT_1680809 [Infundibulicybe gibba]|nr:hypothetical protein BD779DRAFT_1680809 [Infundibulicybe gibba]
MPIPFIIAMSLAILHLITWWFPLSPYLKVPSWTSLELEFFSCSFTPWAYTRRALAWLDETYSHSQDVVYWISLCLQDIAEDDVQHTGLMPSTSGAPSPDAEVIESYPNFDEADRNIIAVKYLAQSAPFAMSYDQNFTLLKRLIHNLNSSDHQIPSLEPLGAFFRGFASQAVERPATVEQTQEVIWQRAILFRTRSR